MKARIVREKIVYLSKKLPEYNYFIVLEDSQKHEVRRFEISLELRPMIQEVVDFYVAEKEKEISRIRDDFDSIAKIMFKHCQPMG